ncbi:cytochrome P450 [Streptomyces iconiensis]|uniref:Cytochrome P450 n=1 Tax=Streptomyces iconiensis TaxID=1384038 RepID=A0ABT6ZZ95_9ACTN|nr:cytochrome P450 [Streptomyces iconiensis]MDJ1133946.1 cytochrome P450 [Streptomyces iconiensis]
MSLDSAARTHPPAYPPPRSSATAVPEDYARLRAEQPVAEVTLPSGDTGYLVSRYEDARTVLSDPRCSRAATVRPGAPRLTAVPFEAGGLFTMDPPEHTRLRGLVSRAFTPRRVELMRPRLAGLATELADAMEEAGAPADLNESFAFPFPVAVICELLGVPYADRERFRRWSDAILSLTAHTPEEMRGHRDALLAYLQDLVTEKRRDPGDDLLSALITLRDTEADTEGEGDTDAEGEGGDGDGGNGLDEHELLTMAMTLLIAGHETTVGVLGTSVLTLLRHAGRMSLVPDDDQLATMVEELLRLNPIGDGGPLRVTTAPVEIAGCPVPAGSAVIASICSANHDEARFPSPAAFLPGRAPAHLAFGHGPHYCLGAPLARAELQIALRTLATRFPTLRLTTPPETLTLHTGLLVNRLTSLPVTWN